MTVDLSQSLGPSRTDSEIHLSTSTATWHDRAASCPTYKQLLVPVLATPETLQVTAKRRLLTGDR
jgi:hypothetical protein